MELRTYRAATMADALAAVKRALGPGAVIVHTRECKVGGVMGLGGRPLVEIIAATGDGGGGRGGVASPSATGGAPRADPALGSAPRAAATSSQSLRASSGPRAPAAPRPSHPVVLQVRRRRSLDSPRSHGDGPPAPVALREPVRTLVRHVIDKPGVSIEAQLADIRRMVAQALAPGQGTPSPPAPRTSGAVRDWYLALLQREVASELADRIIETACAGLVAHELEDPAVLRRAILQQVRGLLPSAETGVTLDSPDSRPLTLALVGPTGVGKTTTIAKLAATYAFHHSKSVGMVTCDVRRLAAGTQLRAYADVIGVPMRIAGTPDELAAACRDFADLDVLLIDTGGCAPGDSEALVHLGEMLDAAAPHQLHLTLAGTSCRGVLRTATSAFRALRPTHLLLTKLDEAVGFGALLAALENATERLSFVTGGPGLSGELRTISTGEFLELAVGPTPASPRFSVV